MKISLVVCWVALWKVSSLIKNGEKVQMTWIWWKILVKNVILLMDPPPCPLHTMQSTQRVHTPRGIYIYCILKWYFHRYNSLEAAFTADSRGRPCLMRTAFSDGLRSSSSRRWRSAGASSSSFWLSSSDQTAQREREVRDRKCGWIIEVWNLTVFVQRIEENESKYLCFCLDATNF